MLRRQFLGTTAATLMTASAQGNRRPNVVLIITDDQGFGDVGVHRNDKVRTPNMDRIAREGVRFTQFHVNPVCSPTRASLLTGRYYYRTGVVDTFLGRSMMRNEELTTAEMLAGGGYTTGIFGKWHLGDNYPMRPNDQGFADSVVIKGGGLGQPSDFPDGGSYFNPILLRNGNPERFKGYCTDIYADEALKFIERNRDKPFFLYFPTNAPHAPLEVADSDVEPYRKAGLDETTAKIYAMVTNADTNIGRILDGLKRWSLDENTIVIFMTDNGPQQKRWNAGMRGLKGTVYEGGIRVPFFVRWPAAVKPGTTVDKVAAHIDVLPTLLDACGVAPKKGVELDGRSLLPLLRNPQAQWADRTLFFQWHRGDAPELYRACAARTQRWKLVNGKELYDMDRDPAEATDVAADHPAIVAKLRTEYEKWFRDVSSKGYDPPRIQLGTTHENPVVLTRQDWRGPRAGWDPDSLGYWEVEVAAAGEYQVEVLLLQPPSEGAVRVKLNGVEARTTVPGGKKQFTVGTVRVEKGPGRLEAEWSDSTKRVGVHQVYVRRLG